MRRDIVRLPVLPLDDDRKSVDPRHWGLPWFVSRTLLGFLLAVALSATAWQIKAYAADRAAVDALSTAPDCPPAGARFDCRQDIAATVSHVGRAGIELHGQTGPSYFLTLTLAGAGSANRVVAFADDGGVFDIAQTGDKVTAEIWRDAVVSVTDDSVTTHTLDAPEYAAGANLGGLVAAVLWLLSLSLWALARIDRVPGTRALNRTAVAVAVGAGAFTGGLILAGIGRSGVYDGLVIGAVLSGIVALLAGIKMLVAWLRDRRDRRVVQQRRARARPGRR